MAKFIDLMGRKFGRLTVTDEWWDDEVRLWMWVCTCSCGNTTTARTHHLLQGRKLSCGCLYKETRGHWTHGMSKMPVYEVWQAMIQRCTNPRNARYNDYGGRGITVCDHWLKFENFYEDMGEPNGLTLDRIDNNGNYEKSNCRWTTYEVQNNNR